MPSIQILAALAHLGASLPAHLIKVAKELITALEGGMTPDEAQKLAVQLTEETGDLKVRVKGVDIVDEEAQKHLAAFVGRVLARLIGVLK